MNKTKILFPLMFLAMFLWGTSWPCAKILVEYAPPYIISFWRLFFVSISALFIVLVLRLSFKIDKKSIFFAMLTGLCNAIYSLFHFAGLEFGFAGLGGVLVTTSIPILSFILMQFLRYKEAKRRGIIIKKPPMNQIFGLCLGVLSGAFLLNLTNFTELFSRANIFFLLAAITWVILSMFSKNVKSHPLLLNFYVSLFSFLFFSPILFFDGVFFIFEADFRFFMAMFLVAFLSTAIGTGIYYYGIKILGVVKTNAFNLLVPPSALIMSFFMINEIPSISTVFGTVLALFAIYFINIYKKKEK